MSRVYQTELGASNARLVTTKNRAVEKPEEIEILTAAQQPRPLVL